MKLYKPMFRRIFLLIFFFNVFSNSIFGQPSGKEEMGTNDPEAMAILDKMSKKYESYKTMRAVFTLTIS